MKTLRVGRAIGTGRIRVLGGTAPIVPGQALLLGASRPGYVCALFANGLEARAGWVPQARIVSAALPRDGIRTLGPRHERADFCCGRRIAGPNGSSQKGLFLMRYRWFESISLQQTVRLSPPVAFEGREPGFPRGFGQLAWRPGQQRLPGCFDIASTGGNISVGPYSSTAVRLVVAPGLTRGRSLNSDRAQAKPSTIR